MKFPKSLFFCCNGLHQAGFFTCEKRRHEVIKICATFKPGVRGCEVQPTFPSSDGKNCRCKLITQLSLPSEMAAQKRGVVFYGDETWLKMFPPKAFKRAEGVTSFFVTDFTEVDANVTRHLDRELKAGDWELMILHYLGESPIYLEIWLSVMGCITFHLLDLTIYIASCQFGESIDERQQSSLGSSTWWPM